MAEAALIQHEDREDALANLLVAHEHLLQQNRSLMQHNQELKNKVHYLQERMETAVQNMRRDLNPDIDYLVAARNHFKLGKLADGMYDLERALSSFDSAWRTRA